jgi:hypothetical protein
MGTNLPYVVVRPFSCWWFSSVNNICVVWYTLDLRLPSRLPWPAALCQGQLRQSHCLHHWKRWAYFLSPKPEGNIYRNSEKLFHSGVGETNNKSLTIQEALDDYGRIDYYHKHLLALQSAIRSIRAPSTVYRVSYKFQTKSLSLTRSGLQGRRKREGILRMVTAWQLRMGERVHG